MYQDTGAQRLQAFFYLVKIELFNIAVCDYAQAAAFHFSLPGHGGQIGEGIADYNVISKFMIPAYRKCTEHRHTLILLSEF